MSSLYATHEVFNQGAVLQNYSLWKTDIILQETLKREGLLSEESNLAQFGQLMGSAEMIDCGFKANEFLPILKTHDRYGRRIDQVEYHPAYHRLMQVSVQYGSHSLAWEGFNQAQLLRTFYYLMDAQNEAGHICPITMTYAVVPVLRRYSDKTSVWLSKIISRHYDPSFLPITQKKGLILGMAMTEKQGGSDVRANTTTAAPLSASSEEYLLTGHKWFCSAPMSDAFLVLAQAPKGLTCFLVPRFKPDEQQNPIYIQRLKNKLGNKSNASSEIEFLNTWALRLGEEGRGVSTIIEMVNHTRFDCILGSVALMRRALVEAICHAKTRFVFSKLLIDQPLMQNVLADLSLELEAAQHLAFRLAMAYDSNKPEEIAFRRLATAIGKYWVCKRAPYFIYEAMECLGGMGYVEETILPRLYREAPVNSIWEGSGNINCVDTLRAMNKTPEVFEAFRLEISKTKGEFNGLERYLEKINLNEFADESQARVLIQNLVLVLQASLLLRFSPSEVFSSFYQTRLKTGVMAQFGVLPSSSDFRFILQRAFPGY